MCHVFSNKTCLCSALFLQAFAPVVTTVIVIAYAQETLKVAINDATRLSKAVLKKVLRSMRATSTPTPRVASGFFMAPRRACAERRPVFFSGVWRV